MALISLKNDYAFKELFTYEKVRKQFLSDVLGIPAEEIHQVRITNPHLWKRFRHQKQGILDMAMELKDGAKINIEMQVRRQKHWIRRILFYLAKMYTEDLKVGQDYGKLRRCVSISLLDFDLLEGEEYHWKYRLRDEEGQELTDLFELHIIELRKPLSGKDPVDDWIRLFNAEKEEELEMLKNKNPGMNEAIGAVKTMSLSRTLRYLYEQKLKEKRDRRAEDEYVWDDGRKAGLAEGMEKGIEKGMEKGMAKGEAKGKTDDILQLLEDLGPIPDSLSEKIRAQEDITRLNQWLKSAARSKTIDEFQAIITQEPNESGENQ